MIDENHEFKWVHSIDAYDFKELSKKLVSIEIGDFFHRIIV